VEFKLNVAELLAVWHAKYACRDYAIYGHDVRLSVCNVVGCEATQFAVAVTDENKVGRAVLS